jgi:hypothetical protein
MAGATVAIYGIFYDLAAAKSSVEKLLAENVAETDVRLHDPQTLGLKDLAHDRDDKSGSSTAVVTSSVAIGGALGLAVGVGALAIPVVGPLVAAAPLLGALAGFGAGGAVGGSIDAVDSADTAEPGIRQFEGQIAEGGILVAVQCHDENAVGVVTEVLRNSGARTISQS